MGRDFNVVTFNLVSVENAGYTSLKNRPSKKQRLALKKKVAKRRGFEWVPAEEFRKQKKQFWANVLEDIKKSALPEEPPLPVEPESKQPPPPIDPQFSSLDERIEFIRNRYCIHDKDKYICNICISDFQQNFKIPKKPVKSEKKEKFIVRKYFQSLENL